MNIALSLLSLVLFVTLLVTVSSLSSKNNGGLDRRTAMVNTVGAAAAAVSAGVFPFAATGAEKGRKVVVMGGAGYVGSRVSVALAKEGFEVISVSRSSGLDQAAKIKANTGTTPSIEYVSLDATQDDLAGVMKGASAVVSCVSRILYK